MGGLKAGLKREMTLGMSPKELRKAWERLYARQWRPFIPSCPKAVLKEQFQWSADQLHELFVHERGVSIVRGRASILIESRRKSRPFRYACLERGPGVLAFQCVHRRERVAMLFYPLEECMGHMVLMHDAFAVLGYRRDIASFIGDEIRRLAREN